VQPDGSGEARRSRRCDPGADGFVLPADDVREWLFDLVRPDVDAAG
jgi:hypothetical protein